MPDQPDLPIDDDPPAELDPVGVNRGSGGIVIENNTFTESRVVDEDR